MFLMSGIQAPPIKYPLVFGYDTLVVDFFLGIIRCLKPLLLSQIPFCSTLIGFWFSFTSDTLYFGTFGEVCVFATIDLSVFPVCLPLSLCTVCVCVCVCVLNCNIAFFILPTKNAIHFSCSVL